MIEMTFEADVQSSAEKIFDVITDLRGYDRWLEPSASFRGTTDISSNPVTLGATYREEEPRGVRNGTVTEFERPTRITFHQPMTMRFRLGTIDIVLRNTLSPQGEVTHVKRVVTLGIPWQMKLAQPLVVRAFRAENERALAALKVYADKLP